VECNTVPHQLNLVLIPLLAVGMPADKVSRRNGAVYFEATLFRDEWGVRAFIPAQVMEKPSGQVSIDML
jgi:hypothetical protein